MLKPCKSQEGKYTTILEEPSTKHSKKPICAYEMLENMFPNSKKLELFCRTEQVGWDAWGNQVGLLN